MRMIHDFESFVIRCSPCHAAATKNGDIPRRKIFAADSMDGAMTYQAEEVDSGDVFCDDCVQSF